MARLPVARKLHAAWQNKDFETVQRLLQDEHVELGLDYQGYFCSKHESSLDTLLLRAAKIGELGIVTLLLERDADVNLENEELETPLLAASKSSHWGIAKTLVEHGADVRAFDKNRQTTLHLAAKRDRVDVVKLILTSDPLGISDYDKWGATPLYLAFAEDARNCGRELLKRGASTWRTPPLSVAARFGCVHFMRQLLRERPVDLDEVDPNGWTPLHHAAVQRQSLAIKLLLSKNADPNRRDKDGWTPLHHATFTRLSCEEDELNWTLDLEPVEELLACGKIHLNAVTKGDRSRSALHIAAKQAWVECVDLLVRYGAEVNTVDKFGQTPLFGAIEPQVPGEANPIPCVTILIIAGADVNFSDEANCTPLTTAIRSKNHEVVELLLKSGADVTASRPQALAVVMEEAEYPADWFVAIARSLCARGAKWDESCEDVIGQEHDVDWCSGIRASVEHWAKQFDRGVDPLTDIPVEVIQCGSKSVESYLERVGRSPSAALLRRCKVCVIGPTEWGKTTLVKALTTGEAASVDPGVDGRTVGIDLETLQFTDPSGTSHEVTLWDFAGQDEYHGAHSLFFSPKSLYLLCIDLEKYDKALKDSVNNKHAMNKFIRDNIFRWVQAVSARHGSPTFVAVGTKLDLVGQKDRVKAIWKDLEDRWWHKFDASVKLEIKKISVNNYDPKSVSRAIREIKEIITGSRCSINLPADDVRVLKWILGKRDELSALSVADRVSGAIWLPARLQNELLKDIPNLEEAEHILELLHEVGDVYWNKSDRRDTIIIDPSLLLEFVKEIITHNCDKNATGDTKTHLEEGRVCHETLSQFPHWKRLHDDDALLFDLKCLLQELRLAYPYPNISKMTWDSDLIVPAYWKRRARKPLKRLLRDRSVMQRRGVTATCEYWLVYKVPPELSDAVFEQFAVQHQKYRARDIWANVIEDSFDGCVATATLEHGDLSMMDESDAHNQEAISKHSKASRTRRSKEVKVLDTINLQVAGSDNAEKYLLEMFDAMQAVIGTGVGVSRFVKDPVKDEDCNWDDLHREMDHSEWSEGQFFSSRAWVPPNFKHFFYERRERTSVRVEEGLIGLQTTVRVVGGKVDDVFATSSEVLARQTVLENLARTTNTQEQYPTRWELMYDPKAHKAELRMLCDLKEGCHLDPKTITISVPPNFLAKNSSVLTGCAWLTQTIAQGVDPTGLVEKLVLGFQTKIASSEKIHEIVSLLDLSQGGTTLVGEKVSEPIAAWFLHELLTLHDPSFEVKQLPHLSGLTPFTNDEGICNWVHESELNPQVCVPTESVSDNASSRGVSADPSASTSPDESENNDEQVQQPEEEDGPQSDASVAPGKEAKKTFSAQLRILGIDGPKINDERKVYCNWELQGPSGSTLVYCSATTPRHSDESHAPSWKTTSFAVRNIASIQQLGECNLYVEVKQPHRFRSGQKVLFTGSKHLATHVANLQDDTNPRTVVVVVELDKTKKISVRCELTFP